MADGPWYYLSGASHTGPFSGDQMRMMMAAGTIGPGTMVWAPDMAAWQTLGETPLAAMRPPHGPAGWPGPGGSPGPGGWPGGAGPSPYPGYGQAYGPAYGQAYYGPPPSPDFGDAIRICFNKYVVWAGRATRSEFWFFYLFCLLISLVGSALDAAIVGAGSMATPFSSVAGLALFLPQLSATVRRLHDTDRSGWWVWLPIVSMIAAATLIVALIASEASPSSYLLVIIPVVGMFWLIVPLCQRGTPGPNRYG